MRANHLAIIAVVFVACGNSKSTTKPTKTSTPEQRSKADKAVAALQAGDFETAGTEASAVLGSDRSNSRAAAVQAFVQYQAAAHKFRGDIESIFDSILRSGIDGKRLRTLFQDTDESLANVLASLEIAAQDPAFELELCIACWERDWNHSGEVDDRDRRLLEVELDHTGERIPEGDPRRRPTFRFDHGDVYWALAMISFQRAALNVLIAYDWGDLNSLLGAGMREPPMLRIGLDDAKRVSQARDLTLAGLGYAEKSRQAYLVETDDDREWVPNPQQKNHGLPLPVDAALYERWGAILSDIEQLLKGKHGLSVAEIAQLGDHKWANPPRGFVDVGKMFSAPRDIQIDLARIESIDESQAADSTKVEGFLTEILGVYYVTDMKPSPLPGRLDAMRGEIERGEDSLDRKLRYLLFLN